MSWLNYHHLHYFWLTAREGTIAKAARRLRVSPSTVSTQIKTLEEAFGRPLFHRQGRTLQLNEAGRRVLEYADEIFTLGQELQAAMSPDGGVDHTIRLRVGITDIVPKLVAYRLLAPVLHMERPVRLVCVEGPAERLVTDLALHHLDLVLSDAPVRLVRELRARSHEMGHCGISILGTAEVVRAWAHDFPRSLDGAPFLLPGTGTTMRGLLEGWFERQGLRPRVVAECGDSALLKAFGQEGAGLFPVPSIIAPEAERQYGVVTAGRIEELRERFYAITTELGSRNPALGLVLDHADRLLEHMEGGA